jgi:rhamnose utilization protein RhaD (predicted bifunctional aldolase and dehydrogenase)
MTMYKHVSYLWDDAKAAALAGNEVDLFIYRSNILGADLRITNYGGGNTSVILQDKDPLTGSETEVMWIKGSGGDIGTLKKSGCAALYVDRLRSLTNVYRGLEHEDEMVELFNHCIFDLSSKAPSIDTPLHGFLPFKHIDHLHPDAAIAIAASKDGEQITKLRFRLTIKGMFRRGSFPRCAIARHHVGLARIIYLGRYVLRMLREYPRGH